MNEMMQLARETTWNRFGRRITFYLPGMFACNWTFGRYPGVSITGAECSLRCKHCRGKVLLSMLEAREPDMLVKRCIELDKKGNLGVLLSGGSDQRGCLPWAKFIPAIGEIKARTGLKVSIHSGFIDRATALGLKDAGVDQALIDVIGDDETWWEISHIKSGVARLLDSLEALGTAGIPIVPHLVCGLYYGNIRAEANAIEIISRLNVRLLVMVSLMTIPGTPLWGLAPPPAQEVARLTAEARLRMPDTEISLGCARQRGNADLETLAIDAGVSRMALPSEAAIERAEYYGLEIRYQRTCCSVSEGIYESEWIVP
ncbi:MAG: radical SAM protein [Syntrophobacteraceae bacterium]